jgi:glutaminyl-peptide cyclotransferase
MPLFLCSRKGAAVLFKSRASWVPFAALILVGVFVGAMVFWPSRRNGVGVSGDGTSGGGAGEVMLASGKKWTPPSPLNSARAFQYLEQLCDLGSRTTGSPGMAKQQELLAAHFQALGGTIVWQSFNHKHPQTGLAVEVKNLIVQWHPDRTERILLCSHYDTRPFPDRDPKNRRGLFVGANDGGSSTAALMELGHAMPTASIAVGVDFVFFDAEELVYVEQNGEYFIGSTYFAQQYAAEPPPYRYRAGILLDMVGDKDLQLYFDEVSFQYAPQLARDVWNVAKDLGLKEFVPRVVHTIRDDHLPLNQIARIPTIDIIDFDYPTAASRTRSYWHTMADTPDKCSGDSITKVVAVVLEWLKRQKP